MKLRKCFLTIMMVFVMAFSLTACGGSSSSKDTSTEAKADKEETDEEDVEEVDTEDTKDADAEEDGSWYDYSDLLTVCFQGVSDAGEVAVFVASDDMSFAVLGVADPESAQSVSFAGDLTEDESTGYLTITDETSEQTLTFEVIDNGDETYTLDMGDTGKLTITACTQDEAFELLDTLDTYTEPVS
ncbi:hypothetical protein SAMN02745243_01844 [Hespellia stercorisuis DSM 15480]|uniref:DUF4367 domain-containing protein n=2 Tax=Hespellia stercorisuis TaxID=180311 RepID=A0A1M6NK23_9FIRM|nr:hypothetical protein SAMN02745243_01844 [Hespellia stercorisuis DSM 15480]